MDDPDRLNRLSPRMREVYDLHQQGLTPAEIGRVLTMSEHTAQVFIENAEERLHPPWETEEGNDG
jgi:DNA-binding NarL/FixJ family response regulator